MPATRSTISFTEDNWHKIESEKNKSKLVNQAIEYFYKSKDFLKNKEEDFILNELAHFDAVNESYSYEETFGEKQKPNSK